MFTSRAEHRLLFNHGSAEQRLLHHARNHGLVGGERLARMTVKSERVGQWIEWCETKRPGGIQGTFGDHIRRASQGDGAWPELPEDFTKLAKEERQEVMYRVSYKGYLEREQRQIAKLSEVEKIKVPTGLDYLEIKGLRRESALKLAETQPFTLGQASRISGVNPSDISILLIYIEALRRKQAKP
jgi:tRNA uridine 5-carboxymethylaminomethyl modification enzyme